MGPPASPSSPWPGHGRASNIGSRTEPREQSKPGPTPCATWRPVSCQAHNKPSKSCAIPAQTPCALRDNVWQILLKICASNFRWGKRRGEKNEQRDQPINLPATIIVHNLWRSRKGAAAGPSGLTADILRFGLQSATVFGPAACCWASWGVRLPVLRQQLPQFTVQMLASHSAQPPVQAALEAAGALQAPGWNPPSWQGFVTRPYSWHSHLRGAGSKQPPCHPRQLQNPIACQPRPSNCSWHDLGVLFDFALHARVVNDRGSTTHGSQGKGTQLPWGDCIPPMPIGSARHRNGGSLEPRSRFLILVACQRQSSGSPFASTGFCGHCLGSAVVRILLGSCSPGLCSQPAFCICLFQLGFNVDADTLSLTDLLTFHHEASATPSRMPGPPKTPEAHLVAGQ